MATIYKREQSPFWYCAYTRADGSRAYRSTGTRNRRDATELSVRWEHEERRARKAHAEIQPEIADTIARAGQDANRGSLTLDRAREYLMHLYRLTSGDEFPSYTVAQWLDLWLENNRPQLNDKTVTRYKNSLKTVKKALGPRAEKRLELLTTQDVEAVKTFLTKQGSKASTANFKLQDFKSAIRSAHEQGLIDRNVGVPVRFLPTGDSTIKAEFAPLEIESLLAHANDDWKGVILIAAHTGLRLSNITKLSWKEVELPHNRFVLEPVKQRKGKHNVIAVPMSQSVRAYFDQRNRAASGPVFPSLSKRTVSTHSTNFARLMLGAGVPKDIELPGGRTGTRTFHSLRHFYVSSMANAKVPEDVRKTLSAHRSGEVHELYTHHDSETLQAAIDTLPGFTLGRSA